MQTVDKAMNLLSFFSVSLPEIGLNELSRLADLDRAAARRYLVALSKHGLIEQNARDRKYRLGPAHLRLAKVREATVPFRAIVQPVLEQLVSSLQETAHAAIYSEGKMVTVAIAEPERATRVWVDPTQPLPLHATASGLAYLSSLDDKALNQTLAQAQFQKHTAKTSTSMRELLGKLEEARMLGFSRADGSFEDDTIGTAAAVLDTAGKPVATVAVAAVAFRFNREMDTSIAQAVVKAASDLTALISGKSYT